jgi:hypothetical protein
MSESESESRAIKTVVIGVRGDSYVFTARAQELWRERWLLQDHLPVRPTSSTPSTPFVGWRRRGE